MLTSPVRLVRCRSAFPHLQVRRWAVLGPVLGARFACRSHPGLEAILHRSSKLRGSWQVSRLEAGQPVGDVLRKTAEQALAAALEPPGDWDLLEVTVWGQGR